MLRDALCPLCCLPTNGVIAVLASFDDAQHIVFHADCMDRYGAQRARCHVAPRRMPFRPERGIVRSTPDRREPGEWRCAY